MPLAAKQYNNLLHLTLDVFHDKVYFSGGEYPAGYFATSIMNADQGALQLLIENGGAVHGDIGRFLSAEKTEMQTLLPELKRTLSALLDALWKYPPFSLMDRTQEGGVLDILFSQSSLDDLVNPESPGRKFFLRYLTAAASIPIGVFHYRIAAFFLEQEYLRGLKKRDEEHFTAAANKCFKDERFWNDLRQLSVEGIEGFTVSPLLRSSFAFIGFPGGQNPMILVNRMSFDRVVDFYTYDLLNGFRCGHAPSKCVGCGKFFLTTNGHTPKYCEGVSPQDSSMTCRQYGIRMRQKNKSAQQPVYRIFATRTNTIRKHHERGKISSEERAAAIEAAERCRDKALRDDSYARGAYAQDMEQDRIYAEARKRLE